MYVSVKELQPPSTSSVQLGEPSPVYVKVDVLGVPVTIDFVVFPAAVGNTSVSSAIPSVLAIVEVDEVVRNFSDGYSPFLL